MGAMIDRFAAVGVRLESAGTDQVRARGNLTDELRAAIREHKATILGELAANDATVAHFRGSVTRPDSRAMDVRFVPEATAEQVRTLYPGAICEPLPDADDVPAAPVCDPSDDRRMCEQCANLSPGGRCIAAWRGESLGDGIAFGRTYQPDKDRPLRCAAYLPGPDDADRRTGAERWPRLIEPGGD